MQRKTPKPQNPKTPCRQWLLGENQYSILLTFAFLVIIIVLGVTIHATKVAGCDAGIRVDGCAREVHGPPGFLVVIFSQLLLNAQVRAKLQLAFLTK